MLWTRQPSLFMLVITHTHCWSKTSPQSGYLEIKQMCIDLCGDMVQQLPNEMKSAVEKEVGSEAKWVGGCLGGGGGGVRSTATSLTSSSYWNHIRIITRNISSWAHLTFLSLKTVQHIGISQNVLIKILISTNMQWIKHDECIILTNVHI